MHEASMKAYCLAFVPSGAGAACVVATFTVGGLSLINAIAGTQICCAIMRTLRCQERTMPADAQYAETCSKMLACNVLVWQTMISQDHHGPCMQGRACHPRRHVQHAAAFGYMLEIDMHA